MLGRCLLACGLSTSAGLLAEDRRWSTAAIRANRNDPLCDRQYDLGISQSRLTYSNLGAAGPDVGRPRGILFSSIFEKVGTNIDMVITTRLPYYARNVSTNRVHGDFLGVAIDDGATATLRINFVDPRSNTPVTVPHATITLAELTAPSEGGGAKSVNVSGVQSYQMHPRTTVTATSQGNVSTFTGTAKAVEVPPLYSKDMDTNALRKAVSLRFRDVDSIDMNLTAAPGNATRVFYFGGLSNLVCPQQARCDTTTCPMYYTLKKAAEDIYCAGPTCNDDDMHTCCDPVVPVLCKPGNLMTFPANSLVRSNLGGLGPDFDSSPNIRFSNVFPGSGSEVDLKIINTSEYIPADPAANGLYGPRARISVAPGSSVSLNFMLVDKSRPDRRFHHNGFLFTAFDLDKEADGQGVEEVQAAGYSEYVLANDTQIRAREDDEGGSVFTATEFTRAMKGDKANLELSRMDLGKAVSFVYPSSVSSFDLTLSVSRGQKPHAFLFTGFSTLSCPAKATCRTYECPVNMHHKPGQNSILCASSECSAADETVCCQLAERPAHPATCDTFSCPGNSRLKPYAQSLECKWEECTVEDEETCCIIYETDACSPEKQLFLNDVAYSNLGGAGPDFDRPEAILYQDVFPGSRPKKTDLMVTAANPGSYADVAKSKVNGLVGALASISVPVGGKMLLNFTFLEHGTEKQVDQVWPYLLTVVRLDSGSRGQAQQGVSFPDGVTKFSVTDFSKVDVLGGISHPSFIASRRFRGRLDPNQLALHPYALTPRDQDSSVQVMMDKTQFQMEMSVSKFGGKRAQMRGTATRTFLFAGASSMTCSQMTVCTSYACPAGYAHKTSAPWTVCQSDICTELDLHTCCDCDDVDALKFASDGVVSNTFGSGLSGSAILADVFPNSGKKVTMQISTIGEYYANNASVTGMNGEFVDVNLKAGAEMTLKFNFSLPSGEPYAPPAFFFSVFDLDREGDGGAMEAVKVTNTEYFRLTEPSAVVYNRDTDIFTGTVNGVALDNPSNPLALTGKHLKHSILFLMKDGTSEFTVTASTSSGWKGRNVLFGGASNIACPERALCTKASCPAGMQLNANAERMVCKHHVCLEEDIPTCCAGADASPSSK